MMLSRTSVALMALTTPAFAWDGHVALHAASEGTFGIPPDQPGEKAA